MSKLQKDLECDLSKGDDQCPWIKLRGHDEGHLCCAYIMYHGGDHHTCYDNDEDGIGWILPAICICERGWKENCSIHGGEEPDEPLHARN